MIRIRPDVIKIKNPGSGNYTSLLAIKGEKGDRGENGNVFAYPVGAIYMSVDPTSPSELFGGNWEALEGRFLIGADKIYSAGAMGGRDTYTIVYENLPLESICVSTNTSGETKYNGGATWTTKNWIDGEYIVTTRNIAQKMNSKLESGKSIDNMPPYLAVYMWKRLSDEIEAKEE